MNPQKPKYFIILVHFGSETVTFKSLKVLRAAAPSDTEIILVDHAIKPFKPAEPQLHIIRPAENGGYGAGINVGLGVLLSQEAKLDDRVIAMNNDVEVMPKTFERVQEWFTGHPKPTLGGPIIGTVNIRTGRAMPGTKRGRFSYLDGAFLAAHYGTWLTLKGFHENYFMYWEDVDLSWRARRLGIAIEQIPDLGIRHSGRKRPTTPEQLYYLVRNGAVVMEEMLPWPLTIGWHGVNALRRIYHHFQPTTPSRQLVRQALRDAAQRRMGKRTTKNGPAAALLQVGGSTPGGGAHGRSGAGRAQTGSKSVREVGNTGAVVVAYKSAGTLGGCLQSLTKSGAHAIIVVDNESSTDGRATAEANGAVYKATNENLGFATAANLGAHEVTTEYILFLNPDAHLKDSALGSAEAYLNTNPRVAAAGLMLVDMNGQPEKTSFGTAVTPLSFIMRHFRPSSVPGVPTQVGWVSGGALLVRRQAFNKVGGFDPGFFLYWEDVDLCRRLRDRGHDIVLLPQSRVQHERGASLSADPIHKTRLYDDGADKYWRKHYPDTIWFYRLLRSLYRWLSPLAH